MTHQASLSTCHFYSTDPQNLGLAGGGGSSKFPCSSNSCFSSSQRAAGTDSDEEQEMDVPLYPFWGPRWAVCSVTCFSCGEVIKSWESVMCLVCFALLLLFLRGLCHLWSHLKQDGLGCKTWLSASPKPSLGSPKLSTWCGQKSSRTSSRFGGCFSGAG